MIGGMPLAPRTRALVGRTPELDRLRRSSGPGPVPSGGAVLLSGDAGIGKSRLVAELAEEARREGRLVVSGHCVGASGDTLAWLPFGELVAEISEVAPDARAEVRAAHRDRDAERRPPAAPSRRRSPPR